MKTKSVCCITVSAPSARPTSKCSLQYTAPSIKQRYFSWNTGRPKRFHDRSENIVDGEANSLKSVWNWTEKIAMIYSCLSFVSSCCRRKWNLSACCRRLISPLCAHFCTLKSSDVADVIMVPKVLCTSVIGNEKCRGKGHENSALRPLVKFDFTPQQ